MYEEALNILNPRKIQQNTLSGDVKEDKMLKSTLGYLPLSILEIDWEKNKILKEYVNDNVSTRKNAGKLGFISSRNGHTSIFNSYLCMCLLRGYAPPHADIYDPFGGGGTRAIISTTMGHKYTGCEIRQEEIDGVQKHAKKLGLDFTLHHKDARDFVDSRKFNFSLTCPPYYNLEQYNGGKDDLSMFDTYKGFMGGIQEVMDNVYKSLIPGSFSIWVVGNLRNKEGSLIDFRGDIVRAGRRSGFNLHDDIVIHSASGAANQRVGHFVANKKCVRIHEYALIFKKPE